MNDKKAEEGPLRSFEELFYSSKEYLDMQLKLLKIKSVERLSLLFSKIAYALVIFVLLAIATALLASSLSGYLGQLLGSPALGSLITAALFILLALSVALKRGKFLLNSLVKLFISALFDLEEMDQPQERDGEIKSMEQLKVERYRVESKIRVKEHGFSNSYNNFRESLKFGRLLSWGFRRVSLFLPVVVTISKVAQTLFGSLSKLFRGDREPESVENEESVESEKGSDEKREENKEENKEEKL